MITLLREKPERTFDLVVQVACPASENEDPTVLWSFPQDHTDQEVLQTIPKFCFPFDVERVSQSQVGQNFTFVLTDIDSKQRFGFCRLTQGCQVCICLLSYLPWFEIYYKLLNTLADYLTKQQENDLNDMLNSLYDLPVPKPFTPVNLSVNEQLYIATGQVLRDRRSKEPHSYFIAPDINGLPTIPESRNLTEYFVAVDVNNMLQLYASMLHERRIIITSSKLSTLTACVHGAAALLFPLYWQHIFIPVLPPHLLDYCCAPMPYFVGVHLSLLERVRSRSLEDVVILNVDTNTLESPFDDLHNLPSDVVSSLKSKLKKQSTATGSGVARAFLRAQAALFGSYRDALRYKPGEPITFCEESFANHRSSTMRNFLSMAVNLQLFKQFIDGRLAKLNAGRGFTDVFEEEITEGGFCGSNSRSYQQWMHTVKRGGALINTAVIKAKSHAKRGIRDIKGRLKAREEEEEGMTICAGSPTSTKSLSPRRLQKMRRHNFNKFPVSMGPRDLGYGLDDDELDSASKISSEDSGDVPSYIEDSDDSYSLELDIEPTRSGQMNLLEEILDSLNTTTMEQGKLSAAKSLDFFRSMDDLDYKVPSKATPSSESKPADDSGCGAGGDQGGWNMGQDDSAVHGKHLPPSPRRQPNKSNLKVSKKPAAAPPMPVITATAPAKDTDAFEKQSHLDPHALPPGRKPGDRYSYSPSLSHRVTPTQPSPTLSHTYSSPVTVSHPNYSLPASRPRTISDPQASTEPPPQAQNQTASTSILRRKVLSKETVRHYQEKALQRQGSKGHMEGQGSPSRNSQSAMQVPWEKEVSKEGLLGLGLCLGQGKGSGAAVVQDPGLLEEIESMCCLGSVLHTSLQLSQVHCNNSQHQVQGKATDES
ncbi:DENN domain-containing protein 1B isoform X2 [Thunnus albacares]|uniref:DENN domain-containing protein 1B isoform X2 n=1 Tax=Thunnus maccoyii TaxID=8240 RepID=UPI001C4B45F9|nr:DENN domain-containing protein 1B isoform X2 [Thunnus maccoyii]XP_044217461.1 DENN domain-containing protein 1B isoform X2 [Thunnus albacares]